MSRRLYYLGLGANLGDRRASLRRALRFLHGLGRVTAVSPVYETEALEMPGGGDFLNMAVALVTALEAEALLEALKRHEAEQGRLPGEARQPRPIDIDILLAGEFVYRSARLVVPHPRLTERRFVLAPLADIAPLARHPLLGRSVAELLANLGDTQRVAGIGELGE